MNTAVPQPICRIVCLGGRGRNVCAYLQDKLPTGIDLFLADTQVRIFDAKTEPPRLWQLVASQTDPIDLDAFDADSNKAY